MFTEGKGIKRCFTKAGFIDIEMSITEANLAINQGKGTKERLVPFLKMTSNPMVNGLYPVFRPKIKGQKAKVKWHQVCPVDVRECGPMECYAIGGATPNAIEQIFDKPGKCFTTGFSMNECDYASESGRSMTAEFMAELMQKKKDLKHQAQDYLMDWVYDNRGTNAYRDDDLFCKGKGGRDSMLPITAVNNVDFAFKLADLLEDNEMSEMSYAIDGGIFIDPMRKIERGYYRDPSCTDTGEELRILADSLPMDYTASRFTMGKFAQKLDREAGRKNPKRLGMFIIDPGSFCVINTHTFPVANFTTDLSNVFETVDFSLIADEIGSTVGAPNTIYGKDGTVTKMFSTELDDRVRQLLLVNGRVVSVPHMIDVIMTFKCCPDNAPYMCMDVDLRYTLGAFLPPESMCMKGANGILYVGVDCDCKLTGLCDDVEECPDLTNLGNAYHGQADQKGNVIIFPPLGDIPVGSGNLAWSPDTVVTVHYGPSMSGPKVGTYTYQDIKDGLEIKLDTKGRLNSQYTVAFCPSIVVDGQNCSEIFCSCYEANCADAAIGDPCAGISVAGSLVCPPDGDGFIYLSVTGAQGGDMNEKVKSFSGIICDNAGVETAIAGTELEGLVVPEECEGPLQVTGSVTLDVNGTTCTVKFSDQVEKCYTSSGGITKIDAEGNVLGQGTETKGDNVGGEAAAVEGDVEEDDTRARAERLNAEKAEADKIKADAKAAADKSLTEAKAEIDKMKAKAAAEIEASKAAAKAVKAPKAPAKSPAKKSTKKGKK